MIGDGFETGRPGLNSGWNDVGKKEGLEGKNVTGLEKKMFEIWVKVTFECYVVWCKDSDVVFRDSVF